MFKNTRGEKFSLEELVEKIYLFLDEDKKAHYKIIIGTDSQEINQKTIYVTAIICHKVGTSAILFYQKYTEPFIVNMSSRLLRETSDSLKIIEQLEKSIVLQLIGKENMEVHIDIGTGGKSQKMIGACINYVKGLGYTYKIKPYAYGASHVADRYTR